MDLLSICVEGGCHWVPALLWVSNGTNFTLIKSAGGPILVSCRTGGLPERIELAMDDPLIDSAIWEAFRTLPDSCIQPGC
jgi:hypothetical protein